VRLPKPVLYLSRYFKAHRQAYYDALQAVRESGAHHRRFRDEPYVRLFDEACVDCRVRYAHALPQAETQKSSELTRTSCCIMTPVDQTPYP
jgi:hypothetical protein